MKTYNFIYTVDGIECQIDVNAHNSEDAWETVKLIIPNASKIVLLTDE